MAVLAPLDLHPGVVRPRHCGRRVAAALLARLAKDVQAQGGQAAEGHWVRVALDCCPEPVGLRHRESRRRRDARSTSLGRMITAIVFVHAETARIPEVASAIAEIDGVSEVYSVTGTIDLIVLVRAQRNEQIADIVSDRLNKVPGVLDTETHIAFRTQSKHDLEAAFSLGYND